MVPCVMAGIITGSRKGTGRLAVTRIRRIVSEIQQTEGEAFDLDGEDYY